MTDSPIRVLCVFSSLDRGGAESMCMNLYRNIDRSKVQFDFVKHTSKKCLFEDEIFALGGRIVVAPQYRIYNYHEYVSWWRKILDDHPEWEIIHGHYFTISSVYFKIAHEKGRITIGHSHNTHAKARGLKKIVAHLMINRIERNSDYCFACSTPAGQWIFPTKQFVVLKNAVDAGQFSYNSEYRSEMRTNLGLGTFPVVGTCGSILEQKNPLGMVDIVQSIHSRIPNMKFLWIGDGSMRNEVIARINAYGLQECVLMTGVRPDVHKLMQAMDVFILPSLYEGLPVVAIEAQAAGLPCLLSEAVTTETAVTDLCTFLPIDKPELWADAAEKALTTPRRDTRPEIIRAGYDIKETTAWLTNFYLNCNDTLN